MAAVGTVAAVMAAAVAMAVAVGTVAVAMVVVVATVAVGTAVVATVAVETAVVAMVAVGTAVVAMVAVGTAVVAVVAVVVKAAATAAEAQALISTVDRRTPIACLDPSCSTKYRHFHGPDFGNSCDYPRRIRSRVCSCRVCAAIDDAMPDTCVR